MKKVALLGAFAAVAACTPDIPQTPPQEHAIVVFNPAAATPEVPTPNDLAIDPATGKVNAPVTGSAANQEFAQEYLNTLDGFPSETTAAATIEGGDLDPASVTNQSVLVNDLTVAAGGGNPQVAAKVQYDPSSHQLMVLPPNGEWARGHKYEVVVLSGQGSGVQVQGGGQVYGSAIWTLARSSNPLVNCSSGTCQPTTSVVTNVSQAQQLEQLRQAYAPLFTALDNAGIPRDQVASLWTFTITTMPEMRFDPANSVIPFPNALVTKPLADGGSQVNLPYPASAILPDGGVDLTNPQAQLVYGLNTLDGFSTTAPTVSENADNAPALTGGAEIDPASAIMNKTVGMMPLVDPSTIPPQNIQPCIYPDMANCATSSALPGGGYAPLPDGGTQPQQLQFVPVVPLAEHTPYGAFVTRAVMSKDGKNVIPSSAFALMRLSNPVVDSSGHSTVSGVSDAQAQQLEPARLALKPFFDGLASKGLQRKDLALAWTYTTESTVSQLQQLHGVVQNPALPSYPVGLADFTSQYEGQIASSSLYADVKKIYLGEIVDPFLLTGPGGTINPDPAGVKATPIQFLLTIPKTGGTGEPASAPTGGWPVVVFGHGLGGNKVQALYFANALSKAGFAMLAIDENFHGERTSCSGFGSYLEATGAMTFPSGTPQNVKDSLACANPAAVGGNQVCDETSGRCVLATGKGNACTYGMPGLTGPGGTGNGGDLYCFSVNQGRCLPVANAPAASTCEGGDFNRAGASQYSSAGPQIATGSGNKSFSGWNFFNLSNLFATRDNFRQQVTDDSALARVIASSDNSGALPSLNAMLTAPIAAGGQNEPVGLDGTQIHYAGQSLGGIIGTLYVAASPDVHTSLLNVPAGDLLGIFFNSPNSTLQGLKGAFINQLGSQGIQPATPAFDDFLGLAKMILDPADPVNAGYATIHGSTVPTDRKVLFQYIENDQFLPNPQTQELLASTIRSDADDCSKNGGTSPCADVFEFTDAQFGSSGLNVMPANAGYRHGFLLDFAHEPTLATFGQTQASQYLATGTLKTTFP